MNDKKLFTIIGIICVLIGLGVIVYTVAVGAKITVWMFLPIIFAAACLILALTTKK